MPINITPPQYTISCPIPDNLTPLSPNGFMLSIAKLPEVNFFCQQVDLPQVDLGNIEQMTPLSIVQIPGEMLSFGELHVQFLVDNMMLNYTSVFNWLRGLGFPQDHQQYTDYIGNDTTHYSEGAKAYSDGTLSILTGTNVTSKQIQFVDLYPTSLGSLTFQSTNTDVQYLVGNATFKYTYYKFL